MVTAVIYMATYLRENPNLERAVEFAASNLTGPLGKDLRNIFWDVYEGKYINIDDGLAKYSLKWKEVSEEFVEALNLLRNYSRKGALEEAITVITGGTREKMKDYAFALRNPVRVIDALGFTFPLIALTLIPMILMLYPFPGAAATLVAVYCIFLPLILYWLIKIYLDKRPWTFPIVDISEHPEAIPEGKLKVKKFLIPALLLSLILGSVIASPGFFFLSSPREYSFGNILYTLSITWGIAVAMILYFYSYKHNLKIIDEIKTTEAEFSGAIYTLGDKLAAGTPLETSLEKTAKSLSGLSISNFFEKTVYNIKVFGATLVKALFDPNIGSVHSYPSKMIKCVMKVLSDSAKKSAASASKVAIWISNHLKLMHATEQDIKDVTEETVSSIKIECYILAPLTCGVIVAFSSLVMDLMVTLGGLFKAFTEGFSGVAGAFATGALSVFQNINQVISPEYFQIIVGIYMIEIIYLLSMFQSKLENGEDKHARNLLASKYLLVGCLVYTVVIIVTTLVFSTLLPITRIRW
jgi:hypothetical protein